MEEAAKLDLKAGFPLDNLKDGGTLGRGRAPGSSRGPKHPAYREPFNAVPFFWSQHYDVAINYVGHAERWDAIEIDGELKARSCSVSYKKSGRALAVATISRDLQSLQIEAAMEASVTR